MFLPICSSTHPKTSTFRCMHFSCYVVTAWIIHAQRLCIQSVDWHFEKWRTQWEPWIRTHIPILLDIVFKVCIWSPRGLNWPILWGPFLNHTFLLIWHRHPAPLMENIFFCASTDSLPQQTYGDPLNYWDHAFKLKALCATAVLNSGGKLSMSKWDRYQTWYLNYQRSRWAIHWLDWNQSRELSRPD